MGLPMAKRLLTQDYPVLAYNRTQEKSESLKTSGARIAQSPLEAIRDADCVVLMLAHLPAIREVLLSEEARGMSHHQMAQLLCWNPARRFGLLTKGDIAVGYDADLVLLDPQESFVVQAAESPSSQGYTPFEGLQLKGRVKSTFLRGELICQEGKVLGEPRGRYLKRPYGEEPKV